MNTKELKLNQEVALRTSGGMYEPRYSFGWAVVKITPTGQVVVRATESAARRPGTERRFDRHGCEMGNAFDQAVIEPDVAAVRARLEQRRLRQDAAQALNAVQLKEPVRSTYGDGSMRDSLTVLEALMLKARAAVAALAPEVPLDMDGSPLNLEPNDQPTAAQRAAAEEEDAQ